MKNPQRNLDSAATNLRILAIFLAVIFIIVGLIIHWQPARTVKRQQKALIKAIETRNTARVRRLMSTNYVDRWGFSPDDAAETMMEARRQFLVLSLACEEENLSVTGRKAVYTTNISVKGTPVGPGGGIVTREINKLKTPFVFLPGKKRVFFRRPGGSPRWTTSRFPTTFSSIVPKKDLEFLFNPRSDFTIGDIGRCSGEMEKEAPNTLEDRLQKRLEKVLFGEKEIADRIAAMGEEITRDYSGETAHRGDDFAGGGRSLWRT